LKSQRTVSGRPISWALFVHGATDRHLGRRNGVEGLAIDTEGIEPHGKETEPSGIWDDDAQRFAIDLYGDRPAASGLGNCVLHRKCSCGASLTTAGVLPVF
jgi:hypothetical protein